MQSRWRVACVRIPRFPIGAVWQNAIARDNGSHPHTVAAPQNRVAGSMIPNSKLRNTAVGNGHSSLEVPSPTGADVLNRSSNGTGSSSPAEDSPQPEDAFPASRFPLPASRSHWDTLPIALAEDLRLRALTAAAARMQIRAGMTVTEARSRCANLEVLTWDQVVIDHEVRRVTAAFLAASPQVTPVAGVPGLWWVGAGGLDRLGGEPVLAGLLSKIARRWHPDARVALADSCAAARAGTWDDGQESRRLRDRSRKKSPHRERHTPLLIPPGGDAAYLATVPLGLLPMDEVMRDALRALGIHRAGGLAALPPDEVEQRWGRTGLLSWRLARGEDSRRPGLTLADQPRASSVDLVPGVSTVEPILFLMRAALERLLADLAADGRAAAILAITLALDDARGAAGSRPAHRITREIRLVHPMARLVPLFEQCRALLDRWPLSAPVCGFTIAITATAPLPGEQGDLLDPVWRDPAAADAAFARLRAELGSDAIVVPVARDEHRPERSGEWKPVDGSPGVEQRTGDRDLPASRFPLPTPPAIPTATRQLDPPEPIDVECTRDGTPCLIFWRGRRLRIARVTGPERLSGDWWKDGYSRDYWHCDDPEGEGRLVFYRDNTSGRSWFIQGWND